MIFRLIPSAILATLVTLTLIFTMNALIEMAQPAFKERENLSLPEFIYTPPEENVLTITPKPTRIEVIEQPAVPSQNITPDKVEVSSTISIGQFELSINKDIARGFNSADGEYLPIFKAPATYPRKAAQRGMCGWVIVEFIVTTSGAVRDAEIIESSSRIFESSAKKAALKYKYKPRQINGNPVEVPGVRNKITYEMEGGC